MNRVLVRDFAVSTRNILRTLVVVVSIVLTNLKPAEAGPRVSLIEPANGTELHFGPTPFDDHSAPQRIRLRNDGDTGTIVLAEILYGSFEVIATGGDLDAGHEVFYDVVCRPSVPSDRRGSGLFEIDVCGASCDDKFYAEQVVLTCRGGLLETPSAMVSLPTTYAYEQSQQVIPFSNPGPSPITITALPSNSVAFWAQPDGVLPRTLDVGETIDVRVSFDSGRSATEPYAPVRGIVNVAAGTTTAGRVEVLGEVRSQIEPPRLGWLGMPSSAVYTVPISVRNSFPFPRTISSVRANLDARGFTVSGLGGTTLAAGERAHGILTLNADFLGRRFTSELSVNFDHAQGDTMTLFAGVVPSSVAVITADDTPTDGRLDFGAHRIAAAPVQRTVTIRNLGSTSLVVTSCTAPAPPFELVGACPGLVPIGGSAAIDIRFTPGPTSHPLSIVGVSIADVGEVSALLNARVLMHALTFSATTLAFPDTVRADSSQLAVTITNLTGEAVTIPVAVTGDAFAVDRGTVTVPGGAVADVVVFFAPIAAGEFAGNLELGAGPDHAVVSLSGRGSSPLVSVAQVLDLGIVTMGAARKAALEVRNLDLVHSFTIERLAVVGDGFAAMVADPVLSPGSTTLLEITFLPVRPGPAAGELAIMLTGDPTPHAIVNLVAQARAEPVEEPPAERPKEPPGPKPHDGRCSAGGSGGLTTTVLLIIALSATARRRQQREP